MHSGKMYNAFIAAKVLESNFFCNTFMQVVAAPFHVL